MAKSPSPEIPDLPSPVNWIDHILQEIRALQARIDRVEDRMATQFRWTTGLIVVAWMSLAGLLFPPMLQLQGQMAQVQASLLQMGTEVGGLKDDVAVLKDDVAVLKDDVAVLKDDVRTMLAE